MINHANQPTTFIFVDYENCPKFGLDFLTDKNVELILMIGYKQLPPRAQRLQEFQNKVKTITLKKLRERGKNALDFCLSLEIGKTLEKSPEANICILSNDHGFDPILQYARRTAPSKKYGHYMRISREESFCLAE